MNRRLVPLGLVLAGVGAAWPWAALPSTCVVVVLAALTTGGSRLLVGGVGGALSLVGMVRFVLEVAAPNLVAGGTRAAEERAVSMLRQIHWAQQRARELTAGRSGVPPTSTPYLSADELKRLGRAQGPGADPLLGEAFTLAAPGTLANGAYLFRIYLPAAAGGGTLDQGSADGTAAARLFVAYAWPRQEGVAGRRVFMLDQDERICETAAVPGYAGLHRAPGASAGLQGVPLDSPRCGQGMDGNTWRAWRNKRPAAAATGP